MEKAYYKKFNDHSYTSGKYLKKEYPMRSVLKEEAKRIIKEEIKTVNDERI